MKRTDELEQFKSEISLLEYAASQHYAIDSYASSRNSSVMRHVNADQAGDQMRFAIWKLSAQVGRGDLQVLDHEPPVGVKDWNVALQQSRDTRPKYERTFQQKPNFGG